MPARLANPYHPPTLVERPGAELVYLVFVFLPLLFWPQHPWSTLWISVASTVVFMPLHFAFHREPTRRAWLIGVVAALGYALILVNPGGNTYLIYAAAMAGAALRPRVALGLTLVLVAAMVVEYFLVLPTRPLAAA